MAHGGRQRYVLEISPILLADTLPFQLPFPSHCTTSFIEQLVVSLAKIYFSLSRLRLMVENYFGSFWKYFPSLGIISQIFYLPEKWSVKKREKKEETCSV